MFRVEMYVRAQPLLAWRPDYQPLEGEIDVSSGDVRSGATAISMASRPELSRALGDHSILE